jgi:hypothetical protein
LRYAIERGCRVFDFTIGDEQYKRDWCDSKIELYDHMALLPKRQLQRLIKQSPFLWSTFSQWRARLGALGLRERD